MSTKAVPCIYERLVLVRRVPYWLYWLLVSMVAFAVGEVVLSIFNDTRFFWTRLLFSCLIFLLPAMSVWMARNFQKTMCSLSPLLWDDNSEFEVWLSTRMKRIFTLRSWPARLTTTIIVIAALTTVAILGLPFSSPELNSLALIGFALLLVICGQCGYELVDLLITLREIVRRPARVPFYLLPHPAVSGLQNYYSATALLYILNYVFLITAVWQGPYGFSQEMLVWLVFIASFPLGMFLWTFYQVHTLMKKVKESHFRTINQEIQKALEGVLTGDDSEEVERLEKVMEIQDKVRRVREWPVDVQNTLTFLVALGTTIIQIVVSVLELFKP